MLKSMAKIRHLHIHSQGVGIAHGSPHRLLYHLLAYYITDILRQQTEDVGLSAGDEHTRGTGAKLIVVIAEGGFSEMIHLLFYRLTLIHGEPLLYSCQQLFRIEGFGKIIVCLQGETFQSIVLLRTVGEKEDKHLRVDGSDALSHLIAIHLRHIDVEQYQVGLHLRELFPCLLAIAGISHIVAMLLQETLQQHGY